MTSILFQTLERDVQRPESSVYAEKGSEVMGGDLLLHVLTVAEV